MHSWISCGKYLVIFSTMINSTVRITPVVVKFSVISMQKGGVAIWKALIKQRLGFSIKSGGCLQSVSTAVKAAHNHSSFLTPNLHKIFLSITTLWSACIQVGPAGRVVQNLNHPGSLLAVFINVYINYVMETDLQMWWYMDSQMLIMERATGGGLVG